MKEAVNATFIVGKIGLQRKVRSGIHPTNGFGLRRIHLKPQGAPSDQDDSCRCRPAVSGGRLRFVGKTRNAQAALPDLSNGLGQTTSRASRSPGWLLWRQQRITTSCPLRDMCRSRSCLKLLADLTVHGSSRGKFRCQRVAFLRHHYTNQSWLWALGFGHERHRFPHCRSFSIPACIQQQCPCASVPTTKEC